MEIRIQLPTLSEKTLTDIHPNDRHTAVVVPNTDITWSSVDVERVEGETYYEARCLVIGQEEQMVDSNNSSPASVPTIFRSHTSLPLSDAVDLLLGIDHTGLMAWEGSRQLLKWLGWVYFNAGNAAKQQRGTRQTASSTSRHTTVVELGAGCGFLSVALMSMLDQNMLSLQRPSTEPTSEEVVSQYGKKLYQSLFGSNFGKADQKQQHHHVHVCVTDGNDECVELIHKNTILHESLRPQIKKGSEIDRTDATSSSEARVYWWGNEGTAASIIQKSLTFSQPESQHDNELVIIAGDVVYGMEAIEPLNKAATDLALAHDCACQVSNPAWVLSWMPRCLTTGQNLSLFESLLKEINGKEARGIQIEKKWVLKEIFLRDGATCAVSQMTLLQWGTANPMESILAASAASAENHHLFQSCAMDGCILCLFWE